MIQQVNLYQEILKQSRSGSKFNAVLWALGGIVFFLGSYCAFVVWNTHNLQTTLKLANSDLHASKAALDSLQAKYPDTQPDKLLIAEINRVRKTLDSLAQVAHLLADKQADHNQGFSKYLRGLANQATREVWLNAIHINSDSNSFSLNGSTIEAAQVPLFLQKLQNEMVFRGKTFVKLNMEKSATHPDQIDFTVSTATSPVDEGLP